MVYGSSLGADPQPSSCDSCVRRRLQLLTAAAAVTASGARLPDLELAVVRLSAQTGPDSDLTVLNEHYGVSDNAEQTKSLEVQQRV